MNFVIVNAVCWAVAVGLVAFQEISHQREIQRWRKAYRGLQKAFNEMNLAYWNERNKRERSVK